VKPPSSTPPVRQHNDSPRTDARTEDAAAQRPPRRDPQRGEVRHVCGAKAKAADAAARRLRAKKACEAAMAVG